MIFKNEIEIKENKHLLELKEHLNSAFKNVFSFTITPYRNKKTQELNYILRGYTPMEHLEETFNYKVIEKKGTYNEVKDYIQEKTQGVINLLIAKKVVKRDSNGDLIYNVRESR